MRSALRFFIFTFLIGILFLFLVSKPSNAQYSLPTNTNSDVPRNLHTYSQNVLLNVLSSFSCVLTGIDPLEPGSKCLGLDPVTKKIGYVNSNGGALGGMASLIGMTYNLPIHTSDYVKYMASNFGLVKKSYAAPLGIGAKVGLGVGEGSPGFTGLQPIVGVWKIFRDFAYLLFMLIFIVIGMAIMLRVKIDPRTVMTIQNQIPKLIIGLVLVTLSFAIAGLLIDLMWLIIYLIISIFSTVKNPVTGQVIIDSAKIAGNLTTDPFHFMHDQVGLGFWNFIWPVAWDLGGVIGELIGNILSSISWGILFWVKWAISPIISLILAVILPIVIFFVLFRLWFTLIQSFVLILINVIFAPFWILAGLLPSKQTGFGGWIKSMLANISVFPVVVLMFVLGKIFIETIGSSTQFVPPLLGDTLSKDGIKAIIALGVILLTPNVANMTKAAFKSPNMNLGVMFKPVGAATRSVGQTVSKSSRAAFYARKGTLQQPEEKLGTLTSIIRGALSAR